MRAPRREPRRGGVLALDLYAIQAQVAVVVKDTTTFAAVQKRILLTCAKVDSKAFAGRLSALLRMSVGGGFEPVEIPPRPFRRKEAATLRARAYGARACSGAAERASRSLGLVLQQSGAQRGYLYLSQSDGFVLAASRSVEPPPIEAEDWLQVAPEFSEAPEGAQRRRPREAPPSSGSASVSSRSSPTLAAHRSRRP
jgi:hypothetical protein